MRRYGAYGVALAGVVTAVFFLFYGFFAGWGSAQWGPYSEWLAGGLTLAAVAIALWQTFRAENARRIDHEIARRRECIAALSAVWAVITKMALRHPEISSFFEALPKNFNPGDDYDGVIVGDRGASIEAQIHARYFAFTNLWLDEMEPPLFVALTILHGTPLDYEIRRMAETMRRAAHTELMSVTQTALKGERPDVSAMDAAWSEVLSKREMHLDLARKYFSLRLDAVEHSKLLR